MKLTLACAVVALLPLSATCQIYDTNGEYVEAFAGSAFEGHIDGQGAQTMFEEPTQIVADKLGNLFVLNDTTLRKITPSAEVSTVATNLTADYIAVDSSNTVWCMSVVVYQTVARASFFTTNGSSGAFDFGVSHINPSGFCINSTNGMFIADSGNHQILSYNPNMAPQVFVGSGNQGVVDGTGIFDSFFQPSVMTCDSANNIYLYDGGLIRRITPGGVVTTIAGTFESGASRDGVSPQFQSVNSMCFDPSGNLLMACGSCVRSLSVETNAVTLAGSFLQTGFTNGIGMAALFSGADGVCYANGKVYVADANNYRIRVITNSAAAQVISRSQIQIDSYAGLRITGTVGRAYTVESSPDMAVWTPVATFVLSSSPYLWIDAQPIAGNKFYRALLLP